MNGNEKSTFEQNRSGNTVVRKIAVIGFGCWYPGAKNPKELWQNIVARRQQFRKFPDCRLPVSDYYSPRKTAADKTYGKYAAVIDGYEFDWQGKRIPKQTYESTDIVHWLALDTALQAIGQAGYAKEAMPRKRTGVVVGNTLTGEFTRSNTMRLRWPFVRKTLVKSAEELGLSPAEIAGFEKTMIKYYKSVFFPITEDTLAGGLSNTIAGRICNFFDLHGGGYTVDGACSSSLLAVCTAAESLANNSMDMALAGGVDISLDTFELVGFSKTGALTSEFMRVYDQSANGFNPGEGCGFVVLKRLKDAKRDKDKIYAVIDGWGVSSDGKGGITAPSAEGQSLALERAYKAAKKSPLDLDFIEGHGTGTTVGDLVELKGIAQTLKKFGDPNPRQCGVTSLKSIIGHTKAAAGIGAFIKAVMAVNQRIVPPTAGCQEPRDFFNEQEGRSIYPVIEGQAHSKRRDLQAGVSAMGFGGINSHVTITSGPDVSKEIKTDIPEKKLFVSNQRTELYIWAGGSYEQLQTRLLKALKDIPDISVAEMADFACSLSRNVSPDHKIRAAIIADNQEHLYEKTEHLLSVIQNDPPAPGCEIHLKERDIWLANSIRDQKTAFLFPGQGSQQINMAKKIVQRFDWAMDIVDLAHNLLEQPGIPDFKEQMFKNLDLLPGQEELERIKKQLGVIAQPAIITASLIWYEYLKRLGIEADIVAGHSLGELMAFYAAGAYSREELIKFAGVRCQLMNMSTGPKGGMAGLRCNTTVAETLLKEIPHYLVISNKNSFEQTVISGDIKGIRALIALAQKNNVPAAVLPVANAFHSRFVETAARQARWPIPKSVQEFDKILISTKTGTRLLSVMDMHKHFTDQIITPVDFVGASREIFMQADIIIEAGPNRVLSGLMNSMLPGGKHPVLPVESRPGRDKDLQAVLAGLFTKGKEINWDILYENRLILPYQSPHEKKFIENPLERIPHVESYVDEQDEQEGETGSENSEPVTSVDEMLVQMASDTTGFSKDSITMEMKLLDDLNLDSIKAGDFISRAASNFGVISQIDPTRYATSQLKTVAQVFLKAKENVKEEDNKQEENELWVRSFREEFDEKKPANSELERAEHTWRKRNIKTLVISDCESTETFFKVNGVSSNVQFELYDHLKKNQPPGVDYGSIIALFTSDDIPKAVQNIHTLFPLLTREGNSTLLCIQIGNACPVHSLAASIHLERPDLNIKTCSFPQWDEQTLRYVLYEALFEKRFDNAWYDTHYSRYTKHFDLYEPLKTEIRPWDKNDVVLVTGGARGITAACAFAFTQQTKARVILVGSSTRPADPDHEINQTLAKYKDAELKADYISCDITDAHAVNGLVADIDKKYGKITAVIHGAGKNDAKPFEQTHPEQALNEISPKTIGFKNILAACDPGPLKFIGTFSSIIGITGMTGNAWYAFANETMDQILHRYLETHADVEGISFASSIWNEIGMGARMGSVSHLAKQGIGAIPKDKGVETFLQAVLYRQSVDQMVVVSRLGNLDTWKRNIPKKPKASRFLQDILYFEPGVELVSSAHLRLDTDLYLKDHKFKESFLFPTVFGLEAMAQAAAWVTGKSGLKELVIENISLEKPVTVDPDNGTEIKVWALVQENGRVETGIKTAVSHFRESHFTAEFVFDPVDLKPEKVHFPEKPLPLEPQKDLYGPLLFQGALFQRIHAVYTLDGKQALLGIDKECGGRKNCYANHFSKEFILGDPFVRDALLHSVQISIPKDLSLPVYIEKIQISDTENRGKIGAKSEIFSLENDIYNSNVVKTTDNGKISEKLLGYKLKIMEKNPDMPDAVEMADPCWKYGRIIQEKIADRVDSAENTPQIVLFRHKNLQSLPAEQRHAMETPFIAKAIAKIPEFRTHRNHYDIEWTQEGKPTVKGTGQDIHISLSHHDEWCLVAASQNIIGCDLEPLSSAKGKDWNTLLSDCGKKFYSGLLEKELDHQLAGLYAWTACEAFFKATGKREFRCDEIKMRATDQGISVRSDAKIDIGCFTVALSDNRPFVMSLALKKTERPDKIPNLIKKDNDVYSYTAVGPQEQEMLVHRFRLTFRDAVGFLRLPIFYAYAFWMGKLRELSVEPVADNLIPDFSSGEWGMVTNDSSVHIVGHARALDLIEGRLWISRVWGRYGTSFDLTYDWIKIKPDGEKERIGYTYLSSTWVKVVDRGKVEIAPFPDYMQKLMDKMSPQVANSNELPKLKSGLGHLDQGPKIIAVEKSPKNQPVFTQTFFTTFEDTNLVGNIYFANYYLWQSRMIFKLFFSIAPDFLQAKIQDEELFSISSKVEHLREAMPFDRVRVDLYISKVCEKGLSLFFEYFKLTDENSMEKIAWGENQLCWVKREKKSGLVRACSIPEPVLKNLIDTAHSFQEGT